METKLAVKNACIFHLREAGCTETDNNLGTLLQESEALEGELASRNEPTVPRPLAALGLAKQKYAHRITATSDSAKSTRRRERPEKPRELNSSEQSTLPSRS